MKLNHIILPILFLFCWIPNVIAQENGAMVDLETYLKAQNIAAEGTDYGLYYTFTEKGTGRKPKVGDYLALNFKGKLLDGKVFQASDPTDPFVFQVGYRQVIKGWDLGIRAFPLGSKGTIYLSLIHISEPTRPY